jgi:hypothetical protein
MILDSRNLYGRGDVLRFELPPPTLVERVVVGNEILIEAPRSVLVVQARIRLRSI